MTKMTNDEMRVLYDEMSHRLKESEWEEISSYVTDLLGNACLSLQRGVVALIQGDGESAKSANMRATIDVACSAYCLFVKSGEDEAAKNALQILEMVISASQELGLDLGEELTSLLSQIQRPN